MEVLMRLDYQTYCIRPLVIKYLNSSFTLIKQHSKQSKRSLCRLRWYMTMHTFSATKADELK